MVIDVATGMDFRFLVRRGQSGSDQASTYSLSWSGCLHCRRSVVLGRCACSEGQLFQAAPQRVISVDHVKPPTLQTPLPAHCCRAGHAPTARSPWPKVSRPGTAAQPPGQHSIARQAIFRRKICREGAAPSCRRHAFGVTGCFRWVALCFGQGMTLRDKGPGADVLSTRPRPCDALSFERRTPPPGFSLCRGPRW